jgi:hypothetical protein
MYRALELFDALIGSWATEAAHPLFDAVVPGVAPSTASSLAMSLARCDGPSRR